MLNYVTVLVVSAELGWGEGKRGGKLVVRRRGGLERNYDSRVRYEYGYTGGVMVGLLFIIISNIGLHFSVCISFMCSFCLLRL
jgi:hypothetical protein